MFVERGEVLEDTFWSSWRWRQSSSLWLWAQSLQILENILYSVEDNIKHHFWSAENENNQTKNNVNF